MKTPVSCPVCQGSCSPFDVVDFNKSCEEHRGKFLPLAEIPVYYFLCMQCKFCFAPEISRWSLDEFAEKIYNEEYVLVDPDYIEVRPRGNAQALIGMFGGRGGTIRHLDYGGGSGLLSSSLNRVNWQSTTYDPFVNKDVNLHTLGKFDLITAYEVFEHVPDVWGLMDNLSLLLAPEGVILFSTLVTDGNIIEGQRINWWYASPRNGHISLFSKESLYILAEKKELNFGSFSDGFHAFWKVVPSWAKHLIPED